MNLDIDQRTPGKLFGVCARIADTTNVDPLPLRVAAILFACCAFHATIVAYCLTALALRLTRD